MPLAATQPEGGPPSLYFASLCLPNVQGEAWSQLLVQGAIEGAHHLEGFLLKWQYGMLQVWGELMCEGSTACCRYGGSSCVRAVRVRAHHTGMLPSESTPSEPYTCRTPAPPSPTCCTWALAAPLAPEPRPCCPSVCGGGRSAGPRWRPSKAVVRMLAYLYSLTFPHTHNVFFSTKFQHKTRREIGDHPITIAQFSLVSLALP